MLVRPGPSALVALCATQFLFWVAIVVDGSTELGYRNAVTPDRLQGRMNTTMRSINRGAVVLGAPLGGLVAVVTSYRVALCIGVAGMAVATVALALSPFRRAR